MPLYDGAKNQITHTQLYLSISTQKEANDVSPNGALSSFYFFLVESGFFVRIMKKNISIFFVVYVSISLV